MRGRQRQRQRGPRQAVPRVRLWYLARGGEGGADAPEVAAGMAPRTSVQIALAPGYATGVNTTIAARLQNKASHIPAQGRAHMARV